MAEAVETAVTAGELALGVLDGEERADALRRVIAEPAFAREVEWWRTQLAALFESWPEEAVPAGVETRVLASIDGRSDAAAKRAKGKNREGMWRITAFAASIIAIVSVGALLVPQRRPVPTAPTVIQMTAPAALPAPSPLLAAIGTAEDIKEPVLLAAVYDPATRSVRIVGTINIPEQRNAELWAINADGKPRPLGLLTNDSATRLTLGTPIAAGETLAVSIEPVGGSKTGTPTGPVVATGPLIET